MPLTIKHEEVERLVNELAVSSGATKTELVRRALLLLKQRESRPARPRSQRVKEFLDEVAPLLEGARMPSKQEREAIWATARRAFDGPRQ